LKIGKRIYVTFGQACRITCLDAVGRTHRHLAWVEWLPHFYLKGIAQKFQGFSFGASWLIFFFSFDLWPSWAHEMNEQAAQVKRA